MTAKAKKINSPVSILCRANQFFCAGFASCSTRMSLYDQGNYASILLRGGSPGSIWHPTLLEGERVQRAGTDKDVEIQIVVRDGPAGPFKRASEQLVLSITYTPNGGTSAVLLTERGGSDIRAQKRKRVSTSSHLWRTAAVGLTDRGSLSERALMAARPLRLADDDGLGSRRSEAKPHWCPIRQPRLDPRRN
jgi:hypothetical protein